MVVLLLSERMVKDRDLFGLKGLAALSSLRSVEEFRV
jgi:hypothetical protein